MEQDAALKDQLVIPLGDKTKLHIVRAEDAEELFAVIDRNRNHLRRWLPWILPDYSLEHVHRFLAQSIDDFASRVSLTMLIRHGGTLCGAIGLHRINDRDKSTAIGYWIDQAHEGKGIATAACRAIVTEGFRNFGLHRIEIHCATLNHRSSAIPRRLGFVEEGILREAERLHDGWVDLRVFSMLAQDWNQ